MGKKAIITVEEHSIVGGLGSAVSEYYASKKVHPPVYRLGLPDAYPHGASHETLLKDYHLDQNGIFILIKSVMER